MNIKINKPVRLIELFAGIGSQAKALERLGVDFEHYRVCEFDKYAIMSYNAIHDTNFETSDITQLSAADLGIVDTDNYMYILTYSFPCQDLSQAGKQAGMDKGSGTRSGLLWEVERLLDECDELPQILLMENVPQVHGKKNIDNFTKWCTKLEQLGYRNYAQDLNAKNYGIPQNRNRCFMVSVLGDYSYEFPQEEPLRLRLKDLLDTNVPEKFYLNDTQVERIKQSTFNTSKNRIQEKDWCDTLCARDWKDPKCVQVGNLKGGKWDKINESCRRVYSDEGVAPTIHTCQGGNTEPKVCETRYDEGIHTFKDNVCVREDGTVGCLTTDGSSPKHNNRVMEIDLRIRKLTPKECWRLMDFDDEDFDKAQQFNSNTQLYKQAGNSIVVRVLEKIFGQML